MSLCDASSGYESTRSHLGPHYSEYNVPRNNSPVLRYNSLKPRRRKNKRSQFYSLRLCRENAQLHRKYQLYAIPIYKCPHKAAESASTITSIVRSSDTTLSASRNRSNDEEEEEETEENKGEPGIEKRSQKPPPVPAPRKCKRTDPSKHTYQNVPTPVFPAKNTPLLLDGAKVCRHARVPSRIPVKYTRIIGRWPRTGRRTLLPLRGREEGKAFLAVLS